MTYRVQVLDRAFGVLDLLAHRNSEVGASEISDHLGLHKSTVHRLLMVLEQHRLIERNSVNGKYWLGLKLFELGSKAVARLDLLERAKPFLESLVAKTGETAHICVFDKDEMVSLANVESPQTVRTPATVGIRTPVHCTSVGKAVLAFWPAAELERVLARGELRPFTRNTIVDPELLRIELRRVAELGYSIDDEEIEEGMRCVGAPVRNYTETVIASISVAGPAYRLPPEKIPEMAGHVVEVANQLSVELGHRNETVKVKI